MRVVLSWSSGKDSAWTLHKLLQANHVEVIGLLTSINEIFQRVAMHAVREELLDAQADTAGLPLHKVYLPWPCSNSVYEEKMLEAFVTLRDDYQASHIAYGDLYLDDIRQYRIDLMKDSGLEPYFPLWQTPTDQLANDMVSTGISAYLTCIDPKQLSEEFVGRRYDESFLKALPEHVDPCGENGEFHTFVNSGPMFNNPIPVEVGKTLHRDGFVFSDISLSK